MKAPEKVYIGRRNYGPLIGGWVSQPFTSKEIESIEYIRKDALLEWLKAKRAPFMGDNDYGKGNIDALDEVINRLNEI